MSRIDRSLIVDMSEEVLDEFVCGICHEIFVDPMVTHCCRQTYCNECISQWLLCNRTCPNDRRLLSPSQLTRPARAMINVFNSMKIKCKYTTNGCQSILKISEMRSHLKTCAYNVCDDCGIGKGSDVKHNCLSNLKLKIESISAENKRLTNDNKQLIEEIKRISDENRDLKLKKTDNNCHSLTPSTSTSSQFTASSTRFWDRMNTIVREFIDGKFILESKYKTISGGQRVYTKISETTLDIISNGSNFVIIRSQSDGSETVKRFSLGNYFQWIRSDGKPLISLFKQENCGPNQSRLVEIIEDGFKKTLYNYDFDVMTNHLKIEWTVANITKVEVFARKQ